MRSIAVVSLLVLPSLSAAADTLTWRPGAREAWVQPAPLAFGDAAQAPSAAGLLLHDRQIRITAEGDDRYEHLLLRLTAAQTAEHAAPVNVSVDPRFQQLVIHSLRLIHGDAAPTVFTGTQLGQQLRSQSAQAEPRKRELDPRLQISLQAPGAQPGDMLDCEYTIHSRTAQYPGLFAGHYAAQWSGATDQPVHWERLRVSWPPDRALQFKITNGGAGVVPQVHTQAGELDIRWTDQVPLAAEPDTPRWFARQSLVQLSDFGSWTPVAALLAAQYAGPDPQPPPIQPTLNAAPALILNALRLVQEKVQPISGIGAGPYAPAEPALVLQRGYGDSRDLARLLAWLLQRLGIEAHVALADSRRGAVLDTSLPSPFVLDSGLVVVRVGPREYWLNPAEPGPAAALSATDPADLRHALLLAADAGRVVALPQPALDSRLRSVTQQFDLRAGNARPAALTVITRYQGGWAQAVRGELQAQSPAQLQLLQIQGVVPDYPAATPEGEVQLQDLPAEQAVQVTARFRLPHPLGEARDPQFDFSAASLAEVVQARDEATRQFPLSLSWPLVLEQHIVAALPADFAVPPGKLLIETPAYRYQREVRLLQGTLYITHRYVALADHVDPADYPKFLQANAQVTAALGLRVQPSGISWQRVLEWLDERLLFIITALVVIATLGSAAWRRLRRA
jgi:hypothetical protein